MSEWLSNPCIYINYNASHALPDIYSLYQIMIKKSFVYNTFKRKNVVDRQALKIINFCVYCHQYNAKIIQFYCVIIVKFKKNRITIITAY